MQLPRTKRQYDKKQRCKVPKSNVFVSEQVAAKLRSTKVTAFVPITAAEVIWRDTALLEADVKGQGDANGT